MKILLSEEWHSHIYAEPFLQRFRELGAEAHFFKEAAFFGSDGSRYPLARLGRLAGRLQRRLNVGPAFRKLNRDLLDRTIALRPDAVFLFRGNNIEPDTLLQIKRLGVHVLGWNNDDPFSPRASPEFWRRFVEGISLYDRLWAYRAVNVQEFREHGCIHAGLLRSFYLRELNYRVQSDVPNPYRAEVSFIGHWEPDERDLFVEALLREQQLDFKLWGTLWERSALAGELKRQFGRIRPLYAEDYNLGINGSAISLVFLSKLNRDTYTRRCFEIPVTGTMMLSEYTDDLASLFREGEEAEFFRSREELVEKVRFYSRHEDARRRIGLAGRDRVLHDGHEALDRAKVVLSTLVQDLGL